MVAVTLSIDDHQIGGNPVCRKGHVSGRLCLLLAATLLRGIVPLVTEAKEKREPGALAGDRAFIIDTCEYPAAVS